MWVVFPRQDGDEVFSKHMVGDIFVVGVPVLENCCLEYINVNVNGAILPNITCNQPLDSFDPHLTSASASAVAVWECYRAQAVVYSPLV